MFRYVTILLVTTVAVVRCVFLEGVCDMCVCSSHQGEDEYLHVNCTVKPKFAKLIDTSNASENSGIRVSMQHMNLTELKRYVRFESLNVAKLALDYNNIKFVPPYIFSKFPNLTTLSLTHNEIADVAEDAFNGLTELKVLNLSNNAIQSFDILFMLDLKKLQTLDLSGNNIFTIWDTSSTIHHGASLTFDNLEYIDVSVNKITELPAKTLESFPNLIFLNLSHNTLKVIPTGAFSVHTRLTQLDLSRNRLTEIESQVFASSNNISKLNLRHNLISDVDFLNQFNKLTVLDLSFNSLTKFNISVKNSSIKTLLVGNNGFTSLESILQQLPQLEKIDASWNQCNRLPNILGPNLKELILDDSAISKLQPRSGGHGSLTYLSLSELPRLKVLPPNVFVGLFNTDKNGSCNRLRLSKTGLENFDKTALKNMNICELDLSGNKLTNFPEDYIEWDKIEKIDLQNNPWHCSCQMQWLLDKVVAKMYNSHQELLKDLRCESPEHLVGTRLVHWYNRSEPMLCSKTMRDMHRVTFMSSTSMVIVFIVLGAIAVGLVILGFYLQRKAIRERKTKKNRRF